MIFWRSTSANIIAGSGGGGGGCGGGGIIAGFEKNSSAFL